MANLNQISEAMYDMSNGFCLTVKKVGTNNYRSYIANTFDSSSFSIVNLDSDETSDNEPVSMPEWTMFKSSTSEDYIKIYWNTDGTFNHFDYKIFIYDEEVTGTEDRSIFQFYNGGDGVPDANLPNNVPVTIAFDTTWKKIYMIQVGNSSPWISFEDSSNYWTPTDQSHALIYGGFVYTTSDNPEPPQNTDPEPQTQTVTYYACNACYYFLTQNNTYCRFVNSDGDIHSAEDYLAYINQAPEDVTDDKEYEIAEAIKYEDGMWYYYEGDPDMVTPYGDPVAGTETDSLVEIGPGEFYRYTETFNV